MRRCNNKRGAAMIVAIVLLLFLVLMGTILVNWGLLNVSTSVRGRDEQQAYYTAKSLVDSTLAGIINDAETQKNIEPVLRSFAVGETREAGVSQTGAEGETLVGEELHVTFRRDDALTQEELKKGTQKFTVTGSATVGGYRRTVARQLFVTRKPAGALDGLLGMSLTGDRDFTLQGSGKIKGNVEVYTTGKMIFANGPTVDGNVDITAGNISAENYTTGLLNGAVRLTAPEINLQGAQTGVRFGATTFVTAADKLNKGAINYTEGSTETAYPATAPDMPQVKLADVPVEPDDPDTISLTGFEAMAATEGVKNYYIETDTPPTGGTKIPLSAPAGTVLNVLIKSGTDFDMGSAGFTAGGGGVVNLYYATAGNLALNPAQYLTREDDATQVNLVYLGTGEVRLQDGDGGTLQLNLLVPNGKLVAAARAEVQGAVWCAELELPNADALLNVTTQPWSDAGGVLKPDDGTGKEKVSYSLGLYANS